VWDWFTTANTWLDGATPEDELTAGDAAAVQAAVSGMFQA